ncbi:hypothetical protein KIW84_020202 [Lathyrus oleraceus]|uniref:Uncharacterized protein n=1 Tax=Pisum sativum TaxID=3888 RepID=A0A9D5B294_PEA|nr:hypothetical protein KIW84_020202 [Pisum sativum]
MNLSIGGKVVMINSFLNVLPIFSLSFYKAPIIILKEIVRIRSCFLWGGGVGDKRVHWVSWKSIFRQREKGGMEIKDITMFNKSLLFKWKWIFLSENKALWKGIVEHRYSLSSLPLKVFCNDEAVDFKTGSKWWRDLSSLCFDKVSCSDPFVDNLSCSLGNGSDLSFWYCKWLVESPLKEVFLNLFEYSVDPNEKDELILLLRNVEPVIEEEDSFIWPLSVSRSFSVGSCYVLLMHVSQLRGFDGDSLRALEDLWRTKVPSKVQFFCGSYS